MKVDILDDAVFKAIRPADIQRYLVAQHWREIRREDGVVSIMENDGAAGKFRVWVPLDIRLGDYGPVMGRAIKTIAQAENRSQLQIIEDLDTTAIGDVVRGVTHDELNPASSSVPFIEGRALLEKMHDALFAAACATVEKRPVFPFQGTAQAREYVQKLRMGQTEPGSYLVKLISPLPDPGHSPAALPGMEVVPFERQVVVNLLNSLDALQLAATEIKKLGRFSLDPFQEAVAAGVSANLCEAIAGVDRKQRTQRPVEISVSWSYVMAAPTVPRTSVVLPGNVMPHIAEAGRVFRERNPEQILLTGYVTMLSRQPDDPEGSVRVIGHIHRRMYSVRMVLSKSAYRIAADAHADGRRVSCEGRLVKRGYVYVLEDPVGFRALEEENEPEMTQVDMLTFMSAEDEKSTYD